jgi:Flp pilus assembly pilin Flp
MASANTEFALVASLTAVASIAAASVMFGAVSVSYKDANGTFITATPAPYVQPTSQSNFTGSSNLSTPVPGQRTAGRGVCHPYQRNTPVDNGGC